MKTRLVYNAYAGPRDSVAYGTRLTIMLANLSGMSVKTYDLRTGDRSAVIEGPKAKWDKINRLTNRLMKMRKYERERKISSILGKKKTMKRKNPQKSKIFLRGEAALILLEDPEGSVVEVDIDVDLGPGGTNTFYDYNDGLSLSQARRIYNSIKTEAQFLKYVERRARLKERSMNPHKKIKCNPGSSASQVVSDIQDILKHTGLKGVSARTRRGTVVLRTSKGFEAEIILASNKWTQKSLKGPIKVPTPSYQLEYWVEGDDIQYPKRKTLMEVLVDFFTLMVAEGAQQWSY